jgi:hypothetical protein
MLPQLVDCRALALRHHSDRGGDAAALAKITEAYDRVLVLLALGSPQN